MKSPVDGSVLASLPDQGAAEVRAAVARLRRNQPAWEALGPTGRGEWAGRLRDWLFDNDERIAELFQRETGKPWQEATLEVPFAIDLLEYYRKRAGEFLADSHPRPHDLLTATKKLTIAYRPYPVVGVICPWNNPILLALGDALPALLAGAAVAIKPSELTPLATREIVRGLARGPGRSRRDRVPDRRGSDRCRAGGRGRLHPVHGLHPLRQEDRPAGRGAADSLQPRTRGEGRDDRARRRRPRAGGERRSVGRHVQQRPGMHLR